MSVTNQKTNTGSDLRKIVIKNIKDLLHKRGWTQTKLAERVGISPGGLSRLFKRESFSLDYIETFANIFDVEPSDLLCENRGNENQEKSTPKNNDTTDNILDNDILKSIFRNSAGLMIKMLLHVEEGILTTQEILTCMNEIVMLNYLGTDVKEDNGLGGNDK